MDFKNIIFYNALFCNNEKSKDHKRKLRVKQDEFLKKEHTHFVVNAQLEST